ncbi:5-formyltetrahydrofolate cyclo-ligase [Archaeoglobus veneficus]|uniref:5-formyltetrahydrofolate cyclo-ligase n=1 Tax=Archaeoglobus veneficus (strain DSM 11195 / SNP6) TaxID=693661 RepID=F2KMQ9_ARCVS|nr:5-formyltetrahydrofolate cyclo-ligase [Archaeoglobus veneficus]AEA46083.1 5-formyltetrahydrofolate cyclo-ligase [Archaeoglobus veneficus SNP6]
MVAFRSKQEVREYVWERIKPYSTFPPPHGRIPNFAGASNACERLRLLDEYRKSNAVFCAPDSPLRRAREIALEDGKVLVAAKPHLTGFLMLRSRSRELAPKMATIKGMMRYGDEVRPEDLNVRIGVFIQGCVAIDRIGNRIGKGSGYGDREYRILEENGQLSEDCIYVVVAHPIQIFDDLSYLVEKHDVRADVILTPEEIIYVRERS